MSTEPLDLDAIEARCASLDRDEYNQAVPKNAAWRASRGPCQNWTIYQPISPSGDYRVIADELRSPIAEFIAAAREDVPALVAALKELRADLAAERGQTKADDWQTGYDTGCDMSHSLGCGAARDHRDTLLAAVERVRKLHRQGDSPADKRFGGCLHCGGELWPCATVRALDPGGDR